MHVVRLLWVVVALGTVFPVLGLRAGEEGEAAVTPTIDDLAWLAGTWRNEEGVMPFEETWTAPWGGTMVAVSRGLKEGKTSMVEVSSIEPLGGVLHLHLRHFDAGLKPWATEKDALVWTLVESRSHRAVFRNASRPFPREIIYERDGDTLHAILVGVQGGQETRMGFELTRFTAE